VTMKLIMVTKCRKTLMKYLWTSTFDTLPWTSCSIRMHWSSAVSCMIQDSCMDMSTLKRQSLSA
jgi:hypothetical protein